MPQQGATESSSSSEWRRVPLPPTTRLHALTRSARGWSGVAPPRSPSNAHTYLICRGADAFVASVSAAMCVPTLSLIDNHDNIHVPGARSLSLSHLQIRPAAAIGCPALFIVPPGPLLAFSAFCCRTPTGTQLSEGLPSWPTLSVPRLSLLSRYHSRSQGAASSYGPGFSIFATCFCRRESSLLLTVRRITSSPCYPFVGQAVESSHRDCTRKRTTIYQPTQARNLLVMEKAIYIRQKTRQPMPPRRK
jgi:hypothetical protein